MEIKDTGVGLEGEKVVTHFAPDLIFFKQGYFSKNKCKLIEMRSLMKANSFFRYSIYCFFFSLFLIINKPYSEPVESGYTRIKGVEVFYNSSEKRVYLYVYPETMIDGYTFFRFDDPCINDNSLSLFKILQAQAIFAKTIESQKVSIRHEGPTFLGLKID